MIQLFITNYWLEQHPKLRYHSCQYLECIINKALQIFFAQPLWTSIFIGRNSNAKVPLIVTSVVVASDATIDILNSLLAFYWTATWQKYYACVVVCCAVVLWPIVPVDTWMLPHQEQQHPHRFRIQFLSNWFSYINWLWLY